MPKDGRDELRSAMALRETLAPDPSDRAANLRWRRDREQLRMLYPRS